MEETYKYLWEEYQKLLKEIEKKEALKILVEEFKKEYEEIQKAKK